MTADSVSATEYDGFSPVWGNERTRPALSRSTTCTSWNSPDTAHRFAGPIDRHHTVPPMGSSCSTRPVDASRTVSCLSGPPCTQKRGAVASCESAHAYTNSLHCASQSGSSSSAPRDEPRPAPPAPRPVPPEGAQPADGEKESDSDGSRSPARPPREGGRRSGRMSYSPMAESRPPTATRPPLTERETQYTRSDRPMRQASEKVPSLETW
mmetsp:Transcript_5709/g.17154  ORF Transcript_5709/g.17154 Transcript_5709/m.17154 type:complete len:210 (+) Transcript_5709:1338-1967(+)